MTLVLEATGLSKSFVTRRNLVGRATERNDAVRDVSLHVDAGETLAVVGESGAGKSTVGRMLLRLIEPDAGTLELHGIDLLALGRRELRDVRQKMQMIFQNPYSSLDPRMVVGDAVGEALTVHRQLRGDERRDEVRSLLSRVGLREFQMDRYPYEFSGGQLQRVAIARALATDPELIVCDEPVSALDVSIRAQVLNLLQDLQEERQLAYVFVSHDLHIVRLIAHRVAVMFKGRIVESGQSAAVFTNPRHPYTRALIAVAPIADPSTRPVASQVLRSREEERTSLGCSFAPRCPEAMEQCWTVRPDLAEQDDGTVVACHLFPGRTEVEVELGATRAATEGPAESSPHPPGS